jgi:hypothetical protein
MTGSADTDQQDKKTMSSGPSPSCEAGALSPALRVERGPKCTAGGDNRRGVAAVPARGQGLSPGRGIFCQANRRNRAARRNQAGLLSGPAR